MANYTITSLKSDLQAAMHGTSLNNIQNFNGLLLRAASDVLLRVDPQETKRVVETSAIFNGVWDYAIPTDVKGNAVIDLRPQFTRYPSDVWLQDYNQAFDLLKGVSSLGAYGSQQPMFTLNYNQGVRSLRINSPNLPAGTTLNTASSVGGNGTWTAGGGASNLQTDNVNWLVDGGSLSFNLAAGPTTGYLENSTISSLDLTANLNQAVQFLYTFLPTASSFSSVQLRFGSSSSNYYQISATTTQQNTAFQGAWNLIAFPWLGATVVGSPDVTKITYCRITWTYDGTAQTAVRLNNITSTLGRVLELEYYSKYIFTDYLTGAFKEAPTNDSDYINFDIEARMIFFNRCMYLACQQVQGVDANFGDMPFYDKGFEDGINRYKLRYRSELQKPQSYYYPMPNPSQARWAGYGLRY